ncbi:MAG: putative toxin-antitoxin system toxin component, PIN family [Candidatus Aenigmarchaeota archaeon]|nr:putative toxin-antitoxin system toxin component, PIN family [Candidatus Aenigmarchaeota archaeon]
MGKTRATLDTNILISALGWEGNPRQVVRKIISGDCELVISKEQFNELSRVLDYPKFQFTEEQKSRFKTLILEMAMFVSLSESIDVIKEDPDDNRILESAVAGGADYIISGDPHLLKLKEFRGIRIVTAREFLEELK